MATVEKRIFAVWFDDLCEVDGFDRVNSFSSCDASESTVSSVCVRVIDDRVDLVWKLKICRRADGDERVLLC